MVAKIIRIAIAQAGTVLFDTDATLKKCAMLTQKAAKQGAKLVLFPEAFIGGYPKGLDFGATLGIRTQAGREQFRRYYECAIEVSGKEAIQLGKLAKSCKITLIVGVVERVAATLYCSVLGFNPDGKLFLHHRKIMPTAVERVVWGSADGSSLKTYDTAIGKIGTLICWENYMPLARMALYQQNMQIHCVPTVDDREAWIPTLRHIAREGRCFVLSACQYLSKKDYPKDVLADIRNLTEPVIRGGSCIVNPMGELVTEPLYGKEGIICADIDLGDIARGKYDLDVAGHYARPDIFDFRLK